MNGPVTQSAHGGHSVVATESMIERIKKYHLSANYSSLWTKESQLQSASGIRVLRTVPRLKSDPQKQFLRVNVMFRFVMLWFPFVVRMRFVLMAVYLDILIYYL